MYPVEYEAFRSITVDDILPVGEEMQKLTDAINALPVNIKTQIIDIMLGKMEIHDNQMDIYDTDGNIIRTFNLFDINGLPTTDSAVFKREIV